MIIWLIDATTYQKRLENELQIEKRKYFKIKAFVKYEKIGKHEPPGEKCFSPGLLRIGTILAYSGCDVQYFSIDNVKRNFEYLIKNKLPDIIGFGAVCPTVNQCARLANKFKKVKPTLKVVLGGAQAIAAPNQTRIRYPIFDEIIEQVDIMAVAKLLNTNTSNLKIPPVFIDYNLLEFPLNQYCINLQTITGCPYECSYCQDRLSTYSELQLDGGLSNIFKNLKKRSIIHFSDSVLGGSRTRAIKIAQKLSSFKHGMILSCDLRSEMLSLDLIDIMIKAGFGEIRIGLDSGDKNVLHFTHRNSLPEKILSTLQLLRKNSELYISLYLVTGLPGSTKETCDINHELITNLLETKLIDEAKHHLYVPYPFDNKELLNKEIIIHDNDWSNYDRQSYPVYSLPDLTQDEIWNEFLKMEKSINISWAKAHKYTLELSDISYPEYNIAKYIEL